VIGNRIGRYEIQSQLGEGGFGRVFRAWDPTVGRAVAIKIVTAEADADLLDRFRAEAGTTGNLIHKNIVTVYEFGEHEGLPFLAMELLEGETLQKIIGDINAGSRSMTVLEKVRILAQVAEGLHFAHQRGVIHRDVKPLNVMRLADGTVKILDFGIARALNSMNSRRTRLGDMIGTIMYMAPEQFQATDADVLTDIFAYGGLAYELLTGEHPFGAKDAGTIMYRITGVEPAPIRERAPGIPERLEAVVARALAKDREIRYQSLDDVIFDLHPIQQDLRREHAHELLAAARPILEAGDTEAVLRSIRQVLELDPTNVEARRLRDEVQRKMQQTAVRARIEVLLEQAETQIGGKQFSEAVSTYEQALRLDKENLTVLQRLEAVKAKIEARRRSMRLMGEARQRTDAGDLAQALEFASQAIAADPENGDAGVLKQRIEKHLTEQDRTRRLNEAIAAVEQKRNEGNFKAAHELLEAVAAEFGTTDEFRSERARVESAQAAWEKRVRHEEFEARLAGVQQILQAHRWPEAIAQLESINASYPEETSALAILQQVRERFEFEQRRQAIDEALRTSEDLRQKGALDEALAAVDSASRRFGAETSLDQRRREILSAIAERQRRANVEQIVAGASRALEQGRIPDALEALELASRQFPGEGAIESLLARARQASAEAEKREYIRKSLEQVAAHERNRRWHDALEEADIALRLHPDSAELIEACRRISGHLEEERRQIAQHMDAIEAAMGSKNWISAIQAAELAQREFPDQHTFFDSQVRAWREQRRSDIKLMSDYVRQCFKTNDLDEGALHLEYMRPAFGRDTVWQLLEKDLGHRRMLREGLREAEQHIASHRFAEAESILSRLAQHDSSGGQVLACLNQLREAKAKAQQAGETV
jgi:eukaryotic-like serine/threonine-protein kinase